MRAIWYFDFISPFAYLQWQDLRGGRAGVDFVHRPILFAGLLQHHGHKGPAEIEGKREFTYRFVQWQAERAGIPLRFPPAHPFNPVAALRLCLAAGGSAGAIDAIFAHLWREGRAGDTPDALRALAATLGIDDIEAALAAPEVKAALRANYDAALADGVFGVPTIIAGGQLFWGNDATPMFDAFVADPALFDSASMRALRALPEGVRRI